MKIKTKFVSLSLSIEEINEAIKDFLLKKGYDVLDTVTNKEINNLLLSDELVLNAQKKMIKESDPLQGKISFPSIFISRLGGKDNLDVFLNNLDRNYLQEILTDVYNQISEENRKIISFAYYLDKPFVGKKKTGDEIKKEFNSNEGGSFLLGKAISEFVFFLKTQFLNKLENNTLVTKYIGMGKEEILNMEIADSGLSLRTFHCLKSANIQTIEQWFNSDEGEFHRLRNFGSVCFEELHLLKKMLKI